MSNQFVEEIIRDDMFCTMYRWGIVHGVKFRPGSMKEGCWWAIWFQGVYWPSLDEWNRSLAGYKHGFKVAGELAEEHR